jgi:membrane protein
VAERRERWRAYTRWLTGLLNRGPKRPRDLRLRMWLRVVRGTASELFAGNLNDLAAALTYYGIMSIFPGLLVLVSSVGLLGADTARAVEVNLSTLTPGPARQIIADGFANLRDNPRTAGIIAVLGLAVAFWSATGYIGSFMRSANRIFEVPEGRPFWKTIPIQFGVTVLTGLFLVASSLAIVFTGRLASAAGSALGVRETSVRVFDVVKWPVLIIAVMLMIALLYWVAPNARHGGFRWITPGSVLAVVVWIAASAGFAFYIAHFNSYNRTYGTLGGVVIFLVWLWLTNVAVLLGAQFDAELARARATAAGLPERAVPYLPLRDVPDVEPPHTIPPPRSDPDASGERDVARKLERPEGDK